LPTTAIANVATPRPTAPRKSRKTTKAMIASGSSRIFTSSGASWIFLTER
jgi:hypothetical protein